MAFTILQSSCCYNVCWLFSVYKCILPALEAVVAKTFHNEMGKLDKRSQTDSGGSVNRSVQTVCNVAEDTASQTEPIPALLGKNLIFVDLDGPGIGVMAGVYLFWTFIQSCE